MGPRVLMELGEGVAVNYRVGSGGQNANQVLVRILSTILKRPHNLVGARVVIKSSDGRTYSGRVSKVHGSGRNGVVVVRFNRNIPGQLLGSRISIYRVRSD